ncbi:hypothetical protein BD311DRAFT_561508 [Dichomitus squalens]|uniref:FAD-binding domain-containing protein n=1 Tax=Dichomitus squalens TaxID=114155 RepID=A0A4V2JZA6_9APHY|nr:hypothetical protein BD311DRAFT_561508 [Dichomitus squalens]
MTYSDTQPRGTWTRLFCCLPFAALSACGCPVGVSSPCLIPPPRLVTASLLPFTSSLEHCDNSAICMHPLYHMLLGHRWKHVPGVTVLGDATHVMSPFGDAGAKLTMLDALELSIDLVDAINSGTSVEGQEAAVAAWEVCTEPSTYTFQRDSVIGSTIKDALSISPRDESILFANRDKFDLVAIYDNVSRTWATCTPRSPSSSRPLTRPPSARS